MQQKSKQLECYEEQIRARTLAKEAQLQSKISQL